jgi:glycosyltransferase involved in cell wall biosynthesis
VSSANRARVLLRSLRNAPIAVSVGWRHVGRDAWHATLIAIRALPPGIRHSLADRAERARPSAGTALALAADGRREPALQVLDVAAKGASPRRLAHLVAAAAAVDAPAEAESMLRRLDGIGGKRHRLEALVAARTGDLARAVQEARCSGWRSVRLRRRLAGELKGLTTQTSTATHRVRPGMSTRVDRVLHLVTNALPEVTAGYTVRTQGIVAAQRQIGMDAQVVTRLGFPVTAGSMSAARLAEVDGVPYHHILPARWLPVADDRALQLDVNQTSRLVERLRPAVLHAHSKYRNAQVALALRDRYGLPVVYEVRGFLEETWRSRGRDPATDAYRLARSAETHCMSAADAVVTLAESMKAEIVGRGVEAHRVVTVPNAVDDAFLGDPPDATPLRRVLGIEPHEVVVGTVTTINDYEGLNTLVDAVAILRDRESRVRLLIVGAGTALDSLRQRAADRGLGEVAVFTGAVPFSEVRRYYAAIDVFTVPRADTPVTRLVTPLKPLEAMATGRPVVVSDLPPLREIVVPGRTGALAPAGDAAGLATALEPWVADPPCRARAGAAARRWVAQNRTWSAAAVRYREIYDGLRT